MVTSYALSGPSSISQARAVVLPGLHATLSGLQPDLAQICSYHWGFTNECGQPLTGRHNGKFLRSALVVAVAVGLGTQAEQVADAATCVELLHNWSLIHDDIIDNDTHRRGRPAVWSQFGTNLALLAGDALLTAAVYTLARRGGEHIAAAVSLLTETASRMIAGESHELAFRQGHGGEIGEYLLIAADKTGAALECAVGLGAILAGADLTVLTALRQAASHLGVSWQAANDIEDITALAQLTGKPVCGDLRQHTATLPVLAALGSPTPAGVQFTRMWARHAERAVTEQDIASMVELITAAGGLDHARHVCGHHLDLALSFLRQVRLPEPSHVELTMLFHLIATRTTGTDQQHHT